MTPDDEALVTDLEDELREEVLPGLMRQLTRETYAALVAEKPLMEATSAALARYAPIAAELKAAVDAGRHNDPAWVRQLLTRYPDEQFEAALMLAVAWATLEFIEQLEEVGPFDD